MNTDKTRIGVHLWFQDCVARNGEPVSCNSGNSWPAFLCISVPLWLTDRQDHASNLLTERRMAYRIGFQARLDDSEGLSMTRSLLPVIFYLFAANSWFSTFVYAQKREISFARHVLPILTTKCQG